MVVAQVHLKVVGLATAAPQEVLLAAAALDLGQALLVQTYIIVNLLRVIH
jgi:hypothetical protein